MRVDFYQLTRDPPHLVLPAIAKNILKMKRRLHVIASVELLPILSKSLWEYHDESFLAHNIAGEGDEALQPIILSTNIENVNDAKMLAICDGIWREDMPSFERIFYMFNPDQITDARSLWKKLMSQDALELHYWKQDGGNWIEGPSKK